MKKVCMKIFIEHYFNRKSNINIQQRQVTNGILSGQILHSQ
jgi:hypothetical protein